MPRGPPARGQSSEGRGLRRPPRELRGVTERSPQPGRQTGGGRRHLSGPHAAAAPRPPTAGVPQLPPGRRYLPGHSSIAAVPAPAPQLRRRHEHRERAGPRRPRRLGWRREEEKEAARGRWRGPSASGKGREGAPAPPPHRGTTAPSVPRGTPGQPWRPERPAAPGSCSPAPPPLRRASDALQRTRACRSSGPGAWIRAPSLHGRRQPEAARPPRSVSASRAPLPQLPRSENNSRKGPGSSPPRHVCGTQRRGRQHRRDRDGAAPQGAPTRCRWGPVGRLEALRGAAMPSAATRTTPPGSQRRPSRAETDSRVAQPRCAAGQWAGGTAAGGAAAGG